MAEVRLEKVWKIYGGDVQAVKDLDLECRNKEFLCLLGPSGCGKSSTLRMIAGLEEVTQGQLYIGGRDVTNVPPKDRDIAMVFENYALYPHLTVYDNIAMPLRVRGITKSEVHQKVMTRPRCCTSSICWTGARSAWAAGRSSASASAAPSSVTRPSS